MAVGFCRHHKSNCDAFKPKTIVSSLKKHQLSERNVRTSAKSTPRRSSHSCWPRRLAGRSSDAARQLPGLLGRKWVTIVELLLLQSESRHSPSRLTDLLLIASDLGVPPAFQHTYKPVTGIPISRDANKKRIDATDQN